MMSKDTKPLQHKQNDAIPVRPAKLTVLKRALILAVLFRIGNSALLGLLALFSVLVLPEAHKWTAFQMGSLLISWTFLAATAYGINDVVDRTRDRVNRPQRYLQQVERTPSWIVTSLFLAAVVAAGAGKFVPLDHYTILELLWAIGAIGYSFGLKRRSGLLANLLTAFCVAASGSPGCLNGYSRPLLSLLSVLFLLMLAREIWKDIEDQPGDAVAGFRTLAILLGRVPAARRAAIVAAAGFMTLIFNCPPGPRAAQMALALGIAGVSGSIFLFAWPLRIRPRRVQQLHRYSAIAVFALFVFGTGVI